MSGSDWSKAQKPKIVKHSGIDYIVKHGTATCSVCPSATTGAANSFPQGKIKQHAACISHQRRQEAWLKQARSKIANRLNQSASVTADGPSSSVLPREAVNTQEDIYDQPTIVDPMHTDDQLQHEPSAAPIQYSIGAAFDPLADSLARALRSVESGGYADEVPLHDDDYCPERSDPFFCESEELTSAELLKRWFGPDANSRWFPYANKALFLTDVLFNSPRLKFSRAQQRAVLSWAKELGATVPEYQKLRETQEGLLQELGDPTCRQESGRGNIYYLNKIGDSIAKDMSNPLARAGMVFYPEDAEGKLTEAWHGDKLLRDVPDNMMSPTLRHGQKIYWVDELVQRSSGRWFLPKRWFTRRGALMAWGYDVVNDDHGLTVQDSTLLAADVESFIGDLDDILDANSGIFPFSATSPHAAPLEIMQGIRASIEATFKEPITAWDCENNEEVLLRPFPLLFPGDNPMQAELANSAGLLANHFCRTCKAGGTREFKQSDDGFSTLFKGGTPRSSRETQEQTFIQLVTALQPAAATTLTDSMRLTGVKDTLAQPVIDNLVKLGQNLRKAAPNRAAHTPDEVLSILTAELKKAQGLGAVMNPLVDMDGVEIHQDTPTEILHTILLGIVKYYWAQTMVLLDKGKQMATFQARLNAVAADGLNVPKIPADYMCQYKGGLIGKHFKTISQIMAFTVYDLVPPEVLNAWLVMGRLTVLLWHTEIENVDNYTRELETCINDFMNITCLCSPSIIISKPKFHFLVHLPFYIQRFGPALLFSTERYEAYNAVFRAASIYSNRLAPSRDIAWTFASMDRVKHIVTGGRWKNSRTGKWDVASPNILKYIINNPLYAALLGLPTRKTYEPESAAASLTDLLGAVINHAHRSKQDKAAEFTWAEARVVHTVLAHSQPPKFNMFTYAKSVVSCSGDVISAGGNVIVREEGGPFSPLSFAQVCKIIVPNQGPQDSADVRIVVCMYDLSSDKHLLLDMPVLSRASREVVLVPEDIECAVNLQHDCHRGRCSTDGQQTLHQEREATSRTRSITKHSDDDHFIINIQSLHNYKTIANSLPASLRKSAFRVEDEQRLRHAASKGIREKKLQDLQAKEDVLASEIEQRVASDLTAEASGGQLIASLNDDSELLDILQGVLGRAAPSTSNIESAQTSEAVHDGAGPSFLSPADALASDQGIDINASADSRGPIFSTSSKGKGKATSHSKGRKIASDISGCTVEILQQFCREQSLQVGGSKETLLLRLRGHYNNTKQLLPDTQAIAIVQGTVAERKASRPEPGPRKRKRQGENHADDEQEIEQPARKRGAVEETLRLANEAELRRLFIN
ncbi:hypothetical protein HWV62_39337 [Athelia sp. TMB]|nr:hypothetical protein HWV62_39337 [Athelia sp. TMB]